MDANTYYSLKKSRANSLLSALERAQEAFLRLQSLEEQFHPTEELHDEDIRLLGQDLLELLGNVEAFRDAVEPLAAASSPTPVQIGPS
jgi:phage-related protein